MDTITQAILGAAVGEATLGRKAGNKAPMWGAISAIIPDLDIIPGHFMDDVTRLAFHRGFSHSLLFCLLLAPAAGWLIAKIHRKENPDWRPWAVLFFLGMSTHILLDCFTTWGTRVFWPFKYRVAWNTIFVIDPLYSIPFALFVILVLFQKKNARQRKMFNWIGIGLSSFYLLITVVNKHIAQDAFIKAFRGTESGYMRVNTRPAPFNSILWIGTIETRDGFYEGSYSLFDPDKNIQFEYFPKNHELIEPLKKNEKMKELIYLMKGYYTVVPDGKDLLFRDFRYGRALSWRPGQGGNDFTFEYRISGKTGFESSKTLNIMRVRNRPDINKHNFVDLWNRILGKRDFLNRN